MTRPGIEPRSPGPLANTLISDNNHKYTDFAVNAKLYQLTCLPFSDTDEVSAFQRRIDNIIDKEK